MTPKKSPHSEPALTAEELKHWLAALSPDQPIERTDERYVPLHSFEFDRELMSLRGDDPILPLFDCITLRDSSCQLFSGYIGTGKSTELKRLAAMLEEQDYIVLYSDAERYHDLAHPLAIEELLVILAGAFGEGAEPRLGKRVLKKSYWERFLEFLKTEIKLESAEVKLGIADLKLNLMHGRPFWLEVRDRLGTAIDRFRNDAHGFVRETVTTLKRRFPKSPGVVLLFDSLERLRGAEDEFRKTMDSVVRILTQYADFLRLPDCHVVFTVPPYAALIRPDLSDRYDNSFRVLPAIMVLERGPKLQPYPPGIAAMTEIVEKRIPVERIFGANRELLEELIVSSGGHVRTLLLFLRDLLMAARRRGLPVTSEQVKRIIENYAERARNSIRPESIRLLESVRILSTLDEIQDPELGLLARYIDSHLVLCYQNGGGWFEVHPLVREHVRQRAQQMVKTQRGNDKPG